MNTTDSNAINTKVSSVDWLEDISSLLPALSLITKLGYTYLSPKEALEKRNGRKKRVVLEEVLRKQLKSMNSFEVKGKTHQFSDNNINKAVEEVSLFKYDTLHQTSLALYELITLPKAIEETIDGDKYNPSLYYIDFKNPQNNVFHVSDEFEVEREGSKSLRRPDIVLFCNGIPLVVIECKRPDMKNPIDQAVSQQIGNHAKDQIPMLFCTAQLLLALSQNAAKYATSGTPKDFWAVWQEEDADAHYAELNELVNTPLTHTVQKNILARHEGYAQGKMMKIWGASPVTVSPQDKAIHSLVRPERLLDLIKTFIVFDGKVKKIARYQQYFAVKATIERVSTFTDASRTQRKGGVIWHTTGSGKSLTMFMMALALSKSDITNPKIILVTDRIDLDEQIRDTFKGCFHGDIDPVTQAKSGKHLASLVASDQGEIITTIINKFENAANEKISDPNANIFVLVDESHRSQYGSANAKMHLVFPNACYIGFTGTPLLKKDKNTAEKYGGFIHKYTMRQAIADGAVRPLFYEGRDSEFVNTEEVDRFFERYTRDLNDDQKADLKRKFKSAEPIYNANKRMVEIAYDLADHFKKLKGDSESFKGQFAVSSKANAVSYLGLLKAEGIHADAIMSGPDDREGNDAVNAHDVDAVKGFWKQMMANYGSEKEYQKSIIDRFKGDGEPDLLIVVDKLLTGFDAPRNSVLYIDKQLKEHNILQAIARVNRVFEGKDYGLVVDYRGIFGAMNEALDMYDALEAEGFEREDVEGTLLNIDAEISKLSERHTHVWDVFKSVENKDDPEAMQLHLRPEDIRDDYYDALKAFTKTLQIALTSPKWHSETKEEDKKVFKKHLKYFLNLRQAVKQRYGESIDYSDFDARIRTMIAEEIGAKEVKQIIEPVSIFAEAAFDTEIDGIEGDAAKADAIAARMKKAITENMDDDPAFYKKLSDFIQDAIEAHEQKRISDAEYLERTSEGRETLLSRGVNQVPQAVKDSDEARAYFGKIKQDLSNFFETDAEQKEDHQDLYASLAVKIEAIIHKHKIRDWERKADVKNKMLSEIDDLFYDLKRDTNIDVPHETLREFVESLFITAQRYD